MVGQEACGNQFESAQFGQGVPETAFSGSVIVESTKQVDRVSWQRAGLPVAEDPGAGAWR